MALKEIRKKFKLTQKEASEIVGMPLRTFVMYESEESKIGRASCRERV